VPPTIFPTGVTTSDSGKAENCCVVFDGADGPTYVIDLAGNETKKWPIKGTLPR